MKEDSRINIYAFEIPDFKNWYRWDIFAYVEGAEDPMHLVLFNHLSEGINAFISEYPDSWDLTAYDDRSIIATTTRRKANIEERKT